MSCNNCNNNCGCSTGCKPACNCANSCGCDNPTPPCADLNLDADKSWVYITTDTDCGTRVDKVSLRCLKTFLATIELEETENV